MLLEWSFITSSQPRLWVFLWQCLFCHQDGSSKRLSWKEIHV